MVHVIMPKESRYGSYKHVSATLAQHFIDLEGLRGQNTRRFVGSAHWTGFDQIAANGEEIRSSDGVAISDEMGEEAIKAVLAQVRVPVVIIGSARHNGALMTFLPPHDGG